MPWCNVNTDKTISKTAGAYSHAMPVRAARQPCGERTPHAKKQLQGGLASWSTVVGE